MGKGPRFRVPYRRRREKKTDYAARRIMATSDKPRFVIRISNRNILVQVIESRLEGDYVIIEVHSNELYDMGWRASSKNTPAAYLVGYFAGLKAQDAGISEVILDMGLKRSTKGNKIFAVVKGANDAGLYVPCDSDVIPSPEQIDGSIISEYAKQMEDPLEYERRFSFYLRRGLRPESLPEHFEEVKTRIEENSVE
ncbi:50S ribosomal protein L18 [Candidatus Bathyarchaeota archaeon]|nr:50S ribosomal protein L18 [Candidatus Bathyarchaeota archaeon]